MENGLKLSGGSGIFDTMRTHATDKLENIKTGARKARNKAAAMKMPDMKMPGKKDVTHRAYWGVLIVIILVLSMSLAYVSSGPKLPKEEQVQKNNIVTWLTYATGGALVIGIIGAVWTMRGNKLSTGMRITAHSTNFICYIWFFVIYAAILMVIIWIILNITGQIGGSKKDVVCLLDPDYTQGYNYPGGNDTAHVLDYRFNQITNIEVSYKKAHTFAINAGDKNAKSNQCLFNYATSNIKDITVTYYNIGKKGGDPSDSRTCIFKNDGSCVSMCKLFQHISGLSGVSSAEGGVTCPVNMTCPVITTCSDVA